MLARIARTAYRFVRDEDGAFIIEFGLTFPILILLSFGLLEFSLVVFDYQRAAEATRRGVRLAIIQEPIPNTTNLLDDAVIVCTASSGGVVSCTGGSPSDDADVLFAALLAEMQQAYPTLDATNIRITFEGTLVGDAASAGGVFPLVTLELVNVVHEMIVGQLIYIDEIEFPAFTATVLGNGKWVNTVSENNGKGS
jgi:hypothetical protein